MFWRCLLRSTWQSKIWNFSYVHLLINNNAWPPIPTQSTTLFSKLTFELRPHAARYVHSSVHVQFCEAVSWNVFETTAVKGVHTCLWRLTRVRHRVRIKKYGYFANTSASRCIQVFVCMCSCAYVSTTVCQAIYGPLKNCHSIVIYDIQACIYQILSIWGAPLSLAHTFSLSHTHTHTLAQHLGSLTIVFRSHCCLLILLNLIFDKHSKIEKISL